MANINDKKLFEFQKLRDEILLYESLKSSYENKKTTSHFNSLNTIIKQMIDQKKRINSLCFKEYIKYNGLHPKINRKILEIGSIGSILAEELLKEGFDITVLVNNKDLLVPNLELENHIFGELTIDGIKKESYNPECNVFTGPFTKNSRRYEYSPNIYDFDTIICEDNYTLVPTIMSYNTHNYVGFCSDLTTLETKEKINYYSEVVRRLNNMYRNRFSSIYDEDTTIEKSFYLIHRR